MVGPATPLPLDASWQGDTSAYVSSLLDLGTSSPLLRTLCGGVHILDFLTRDPDLYSVVIPAAWRAWFGRDDVAVADVLDLLMRRDLGEFEGGGTGGFAERPPEELLGFVGVVRRHSLGRAWVEEEKGGRLPRHVALGMGVKKVHEVQHFAGFVDRLTGEVGRQRGEGGAITHIADFGSGQNYLGRALASAPYSKHIIAIESRSHNIEGARGIDVLAGLAPKKLVLRNKKEWRREREALTGKGRRNRKKEEEGCEDCGETSGTNGAEPTEEVQEQKEQDAFAGFAPEGTAEFVQEEPTKEAFNGIPKGSNKVRMHLSEEGTGSIQYVEHRLEDGNLAHVIEQILDPAKVASQKEQTKESSQQPFVTSTRAQDPNLMVISLHSCGNLVHHGLRSLVLNPKVKAVAMIGCCYNLMTERLGPPTYKLPQLRPNHARLEATANAFDPHGFPMSERYSSYPVESTGEVGVRLNITARMMAVQAPQNWSPAESAAFFTRHFFRALLQRIFFDRGIVGPPRSSSSSSSNFEKGRTVGPCSPAGCSSGGEPIVIGSLKKSCYTDFVAYVRGALVKIEGNEQHKARGEEVRVKMAGITDDEIRGYEEAYGVKKKELSLVWSLMAFSAGVVEAMIVVDRWLWLKEQDNVEEAWVEPVFDYAMSPRNLVVVGLKK